MESSSKMKIVVTEIEKREAISTFPSVFAMAKMRMVLLKHLRNIRANLCRKKKAGEKQ